MRQPIQVLVYPTMTVDGRRQYLLLHRTAPRGAFWQGVTGGVKYQEGLLQAAKRELLEETGFTASRIQQIDYSYSFPLEEKWAHLYTTDVKQIMEYVFIAPIDVQGDPTIDPNEHDEWKWCDLSYALELLAWPENKIALVECDKLLESSLYGRK